MKVLISYDGSDCARAAIEDLSRAGLPADTEALVLTAAETWVVPESVPDDSYVKILGFTGSETLKQMKEAAAEQITKTEKLSEEANLLVQKKFPTWRVQHKTIEGFPEREIVAAANEWKPDLIAIGSHGHSGVVRFVLGSVSLKVLSEAACSVRIGRQSSTRTADDDSPLRLVIAIDGSEDSEKAVEAVAARAWAPETSVRLITVIENFPFSVLLEELPKSDLLRQSATEKLKKMGLHVSNDVRAGQAKKVIVEEAESWGADTIFIGAKGHSLSERILFGSVSYTVAARAHCSVEVVR